MMLVSSARAVGRFENSERQVVIKGLFKEKVSLILKINLDGRSAHCPPGFDGPASHPA